MLIKKKKNNKIFIFLIIIFSTFLLYLLSITPGFKGDIEQTLRILLKQPVLLKHKPISNNLIIDYSKKIFYGIENRLFNKNDFKKIEIEIEFSELEKLKIDRKKALELKKLIKPQKIKINLVHKGKKYKATARLKGDFSEHWGNIKQWSLKIKLKNKRTIFLMNEFSISVFTERDFPYNYVISNLMREYNILTPRYETVNIHLNGDDWGLMLLEEQFSDSFYAKNRIKEAPIFKMTNENDVIIKHLVDQKINNVADIVKWQGKLETKIYNKNKILKKTNIPNRKTNENLTSIFKNLQEVVALEQKKYLPNLINHINIESFAKVVAITAIFGDMHTTLSTNSRYYLNPYNLKIEPILTDPLHSEIDKDFFNEYNALYRNIFHLKNFQNIYLKTLKEINNNFFKIENSFDNACRDFGQNCQNLVELDILKKNINFLLGQEKKIFQGLDKKKKKLKKLKKFNTKNIKNINNKKINLRVFDDGEIFINNLTSEKINIINIVLKNKINCKKKCKEKTKTFDLDWIIKPGTYENLKTKKFKVNIDQIKYNFLEIKYVDESNISYLLTERVERSHLKKENFFKTVKIEFNKNIIKKNNDYIFKHGTHIIDDPIIIPDGFNLIIEGDTILKMSKNSYIMLENGSLKFKGTIDKPIKIIPLENEQKWNGIYVNSNSIGNNTSILKHVKISGISYFDNGKIQLTGGLNFINSNINISNSLIEKSFSEDAINIVNSKFKIDKLYVENSKSDGIDIDFSKGKITNTKFKNIGGDAIDLSGSDVILRNIVASKVYDKAISAGEQTLLNINGLKISSSGIGIASKDSSVVKGSNIEISECGLFDFAVFQKKQFFSGGSLVVNNATSCNSPLIQKGSKLNINEKEIKGQDADIENLYKNKL